MTRADIRRHQRDAEREQTRSRLYAAAGEGRLSKAEVEERLATLERLATGTSSVRSWRTCLPAT